MAALAERHSLADLASGLSAEEKAAADYAAHQYSLVQCRCELLN
jgi:hypothetical protein